jgi:hypothetical protein
MQRGLNIQNKRVEETGPKVENEGRQNRDFLRSTSAARNALAIAAKSAPDEEYEKIRAAVEEAYPDILTTRRTVQ